MAQQRNRQAISEIDLRGLRTVRRPKLDPRWRAWPSRSMAASRLPLGP